MKQIDLLYKLVSQMGNTATELAGVEAVAGICYRCIVGRLIKQLDAQRRDGVEQFRQTTYFYKQTT
ncbi:MAG: hypothetical protein HUU08_12665 [Candidatus Brocadia sp.]|nr:hypothetical protein [Candidatus Brocadia sp.]